MSDIEEVYNKCWKCYQQISNEEHLIITQTRPLLAPAMFCLKCWGTKPKLNKHQIRRIANEADIRHTTDCRSHNPKGVGGHPPTGPLDLGGYRCICDFMDQIYNNLSILEDTDDAISLKNYRSSYS